MSVAICGSGSSPGAYMTRNHNHDQLRPPTWREHVFVSVSALHIPHPRVVVRMSSHLSTNASGKVTVSFEKMDPHCE